MPQLLTNYDAEIVRGVLRLPPNCAKLTKGEKKQVKDSAVSNAALAACLHEGLKLYHTRIDLIMRKGGRPNVTVWVSVPIKE